jgi:hypothetical protein
MYSAGDLIHPIDALAAAQISHISHSPTLSEAEQISHISVGWSVSGVTPADQSGSYQPHIRLLLERAHIYIREP